MEVLCADTTTWKICLAESKLNIWIPAIPFPTEIYVHIIYRNVQVSLILKSPQMQTTKISINGGLYQYGMFIKYLVRYIVILIFKVKNSEI